LIGSAYDGDAVAAGSSVRNDDVFWSLANGDGVSDGWSAENKSGFIDGQLLLIPIWQ
jgi:hypothetical protein